MNTPFAKKRYIVLQRLPTCLTVDIFDTVNKKIVRKIAIQAGNATAAEDYAQRVVNGYNDRAARGLPFIE